MWHPDIPHTAVEPVERSRSQFETVWAGKGWQLVDSDEEE